MAGPAIRFDTNFRNSESESLWVCIRNEVAARARADSKYQRSDNTRASAAPFRQAAGGTPNSLLNARENAASDS